MLFQKKGTAFDKCGVRSRSLTPKPVVIPYTFLQDPTTNPVSEALQGVSEPGQTSAGSESATLGAPQRRLEGPNAGTSPMSSMPGLDMTQYALVCFGLVAMILALGWAAKRFLAGNLRQRASQRSMKIVDVLPLGGKRQLAVVRCYDRTFVLGLGERDVTLVTELDPDEDVEGVLPAAQAQPAQPAKPAAFGQWIQRALQRKSASSGAAASINEAPSPIAAAPQDKATAQAQAIADAIDPEALLNALAAHAAAHPKPAAPAKPAAQPATSSGLGAGLLG